MRESIIQRGPNLNSANTDTFYNSSIEPNDYYNDSIPTRPAANTMGRESETVSSMVLEQKVVTQTIPMLNMPSEALLDQRTPLGTAEAISDYNLQ